MSSLFIRSGWTVRGGITVVCLLLAGCSSRRDQPGSESPVGASVRSVPVEVAVAATKHLTVTKSYSGTLEGEEQANIVARLPERITAIHARVGEQVRAGQVMVALDKSGTSSQYFQAEANFKNAEKTLQRMRSLYAEGAVALQTLDGAQTAYDVARANFDAARGAVELTTPIGGVVTAVNASVGDLASPGIVLATIARIDRLKITFSMNETDVGSVAPGQAVVVYSENLPGEKAGGRIVQLSKSADVRSRSFEIKALFPNSSRRWFKPGMFARVSLDISPRDKALVVPNTALQTDGITTRVFRVRNGLAYERRVTVGVTDGERSVILAGLDDGDSVATVGVNNLKDSLGVRVVPDAK